MKFALLMFFISIGSLSAQRVIAPTELFTIDGKVRQRQSFSIAQLERFPTTGVDDIVIYNHKDEIKDTLRNVKGVLLTKILENIKFVYEKPKTLNEFYLICTASDGYKVVFSWNEIYNTDIGKNLYLITELDGKKLHDMPQRITLISTSDSKSGRRYIKALKKIEVRQAE